jgi:NAD dependent epimerase/dehydratase family enzyme
MLHIIERPEIEGPVNAVTAIATNRTFTDSLAHALHRPAWLAAPETVLQWIGMGREILLADQAVHAHHIGFEALDIDLDLFLARNLGRRTGRKTRAPMKASACPV